VTSRTTRPTLGQPIPVATLPRRRSATLAWPAGRLAGHGTDKARPDLWLRRSLVAHRSAHPSLAAAVLVAIVDVAGRPRPVHRPTGMHILDRPQRPGLPTSRDTCPYRRCCWWPPPSGYGRAGQPAGPGGPRRHPGQPGSARLGQRPGGHWHLGWSWNGSGRYVAPNQSLVQTHELGRLGSTLRELLVVAGVLLVIANVAHRRGSSAGSHRRRAPTAPLYATSRSSAGVAAQARRSGRPLGDLLTPSLSNTLFPINERWISAAISIEHARHA
jgi:hypothetical protein